MVKDRGSLLKRSNRLFCNSELRTQEVNVTLLSAVSVGLLISCLRVLGSFTVFTFSTGRGDTIAASHFVYSQFYPVSFVLCLVVRGVLIHMAFHHALVPLMSCGHLVASQSSHSPLVAETPWQHVTLSLAPSDPVSFFAPFQVFVVLVGVLRCPVTRPMVQRQTTCFDWCRRLFCSGAFKGGRCGPRSPMQLVDSETKVLRPGSTLGLWGGR